MYYNIVVKFLWAADYRQPLRPLRLQPFRADFLCPLWLVLFIGIILQTDSYILDNLHYQQTDNASENYAHYDFTQFFILAFMNFYSLSTYLYVRYYTTPL